MSSSRGFMASGFLAAAFFLFTYGSGAFAQQQPAANPFDVGFVPGELLVQMKEPLSKLQASPARESFEKMAQQYGIDDFNPVTSDGAKVGSGLYKVSVPADQDMWIVKGAL